MTRKVCLIAVVFAALLTLCSGTDFAQTVDASPDRKGCDEGNLRQGGAARGSRSIPRHARLVSAGFGRLQRAAGREGMEPSAGTVRQGSRVTSSRLLGAGLPTAAPATAKCNPDGHVERRILG